MAIRDEYEFDQLKNEAERLVIEELERRIEQLDPRLRTENCILDIAAYALNRITPRYHVNLIGRLYGQALDESAYIDEVGRAVKEAVAKISRNPP